MTETDKRRTDRSPNPTQAEQAYAEHWTADNSYGVPEELQNIPSGTRIVIEPNPDSKRRIETIWAHPVRREMVSPTSIGVHAAKMILVPGEYVVQHEQILLTQYRPREKVSLLPTAYVGGWTTLTAVARTKNRRLKIGATFAFLKNGRRPLEKSSLLVQPLEDNRQSLNLATEVNY